MKHSFCRNEPPFDCRIGEHDFGAKAMRSAGRTKQENRNVNPKWIVSLTFWMSMFLQSVESSALDPCGCSDSDWFESWHNSMLSAERSLLCTAEDLDRAADTWNLKALPPDTSLQTPIKEAFSNCSVILRLQHWYEICRLTRIRKQNRNERGTLASDLRHPFVWAKPRSVLLHIDCKTLSIQQGFIGTLTYINSSISFLSSIQSETSKR